MEFLRQYMAPTIFLTSFFPHPSTRFLYRLPLVCSLVRPCQYIKPKFHAMAEATSEAEFIAVDVDENDQVAAKAGVTCMPTFQFYMQDGREARGCRRGFPNSLIAKHK